MSASASVEQMSFLQFPEGVEDCAEKRVHTTIPMIIRGAVVEREHRTCQYCSGTSESYFDGPDGRAWHIDHIIPRSKGGCDDMDNLALACSTCNLVKSTKIVHIGKAVKRVTGRQQSWTPHLIKRRNRSGDESRAKILTYFKNHEGAPPTQREVAHGIGMSLSVVCYHTLRLVAEGALIPCAGERDAYIFNGKQPTTFGGVS